MEISSSKGEGEGNDINGGGKRKGKTNNAAAIAPEYPLRPHPAAGAGQTNANCGPHIVANGVDRIPPIFLCIGDGSGCFS